MPPIELSRVALDRIQELIQANFTGRDELYAAAESLDDESRQRVCRRLAEFLAGHAVDLQQIVTAQGVEPAGPLDIESIAQTLFDLAKLNRGEPGVLQAAAEGERDLKESYDRAIDAAAGPESEDLLRRQRDDVEFGEQILRDMGQASGGKPSRQDRPN